MTALSIQVPYPIFSDKDGSPLQNGYVWIGAQYLDPRTNPVTVYFDEALTQIAPQPLRTLNGYVYNAGSPAQLYVNGVNFSILVQNKNGSMVYSFPDGSGISPDSNGVAYTPSGAGAVATTVQAELSRSVWLNNYATADNATDSTAGLANAIAALPAEGGTLYYSGIFYFASIVSISKRIKLVAMGGSGDGTLGNLPSSYWRFSSSITVGPLVKIQNHGSQWDGLHIEGGGKGVNTAVDNIQFLGSSHHSIRGRSWKAGRDGVKVGTGLLSVVICNNGIVDDFICFENGAVGWNMDNNTSPGIPGNNANAWNLNGLHTRNNAGDGTAFTHADLNTLSGLLSEANAGWGLSILNGNFNVINGGDREANTAGQFRILGSRNGGDGSNTSNYNQINIGNYTELTDADSNRFDCTTINNSKNFNAKGTWTPVISGSGGTPHAGYTIQQGYWWRDGRNLKLTGSIQISGALSGPTGTVEITGLPAGLDSSFVNGYVGISISQFNGITLAAGLTQLGGRVDPNTSKIKLTGSGSATATAMLPTTGVGTNAQILFCLEMPVGTI